MNDSLLELQLRLLILQHGKSKVRGAFVKLADQTEEEFERDLIVKEQKRRIAKPQASIEELIAEYRKNRPDIADTLHTLAIRFENRMFFPNLRDVQKFLEGVNPGQGKLKSRGIALPILIRSLAKLSQSDLNRMVAQEITQGETEYSLLARAIMGTPAPKANGPTELNLDSGKIGNQT